MKKIIIILFFITSFAAHAQTAVQNFSLMNVADGKMASLDSYTTCSGLAIIFTGNNCPYDNYYAARLKSLVSSYQGKIQFVLVNSYVEPEESVEKMKDKYNALSLSIPYLADKDQTVMDNLGAKKSPEVFLLQNSNGKYFLVYSGAIDDNPQVAQDAKQNYLKGAIDKLLVAQKPDAANVRAVGCTIRKK